MSELLFIKTLGNASINLLIKHVENYQERKGCKIITEVTDNCILVYDATNVEFLLNIYIKSIELVAFSEHNNTYMAIAI